MILTFEKKTKFNACRTTRERERNKEKNQLEERRKHVSLFADQ
jgi:hypothetical protein